MKIIRSFTAPLFLAAALLGGLALHAAEPPVRLAQGHTDIGIAFEDDAFDLHIHDETDDIEYAPDEAVLVVKAESRVKVPNDPRYSFLGLPCSNVWVLPQTQNSNLLFLGFGAEEIGPDVFQSNQFRMELKAVVGAGNLFVYDIEPFGTPVVIMNSADGVDTNDSRVLPGGAHSDFNWAFTAPGSYTVTFEASGTLTNGDFVTSGPVDYTFLVESGPVPPTPPALIITRAVTNLVTLAWLGESGATYQLQATAAFPSAWTNVSAPIPGVCGPQSLTLPATNAAAFYRLATWEE